LGDKRDHLHHYKIVHTTLSDGDRGIVGKDSVDQGAWLMLLTA